MLSRLTNAAFRRDAPRQPGSPPPGRPDRFPLFDSLRAIAALSIVAYHLAGVVDMGGAARYVLHLDVGVTIFFVISGFLLYRPFVHRWLNDEDPRDPGAYAWRRFLRIVPAYWVALTVISLWFGRDEVMGGHGAVYYLFGQIYDPDLRLRGIGQAWSLCVEVTFYIALPFWAWLMRARPASSRAVKLRREWIGLAVVVAVSLWFKEAFVVTTGPNGAGNATLGAALPRFLDWFAIGMGLAVASVALEGRPLPRAMRPLERFPGLALLAAAGSFVLVSLTVDASGAPALATISGGDFYLQHYLYAFAALAVVAPAVFGDQHRGLLRKFLANRVLLWIGVVSYAIFLWHKAAIDQLDRWGTPGAVADALGMPDVLVWAVLVLAWTLAIAAGSWLLVERPALRLKRTIPWRRDDLRGSPGLTAGCAVVLLVAAISSARLGVSEALLAAGALATLAILTRPVRRRLRARRIAPGHALLAVGLLVSLVAALRLASSQDAASATARPGPRVHVVATHDGARLRVYVDGQPSGSTRTHGPGDPGRGPVEIGAFVGGAGFDGTIDDVAVYRRALAASEVAAHWRVGNDRSGPYAATVRSTPGLVDYWRLGDRGSRAANLASGAPGRYDPGIRRVPGLIAGDPDQASQFNGLGRHVLATAPRPALLGRGFTLEAWVRPDEAGDRYIVSKGGAWSLRLDANGHWRAGVTIKHRNREAISSAHIAVRGLQVGSTAAAAALVAALGIAVGGWAATLRRRRLLTARA